MSRDKQLDEIDRKLIELLRSDARLPAVTLARSLSVSRATVQNRIDKLLAHGVLLGFTIRLRSDTETGAVRALTSLEIRSGDARTVLGLLKRVPEVRRIYSTNGRWDKVVELNATDLAALDRAIAEIRAIRGVSHSETSILLTEL
ncbi:MAG: Lrp/AsnC family transcriptional regulator [Hyphomicrobiales bacterium]|nr:Lrp/AsnC family transcriptional regulator [Hyphomicrobiales bacterium]